MSRLAEQLKRQEQSGKCALKLYRCPAGRLTIGWGHNIEANPLTGFIRYYFNIHDEITREMADYMLDQDLVEAALDASEHIPHFAEMDNVRQDVIINMIFNLGMAGVLGFHDFIRALRSKDYAAAAEAMRDSKWYRQLGGDPAGTNDGVLERPEEEIAMMQTGQYVK